MSRRTIALIVAVALAALATIALISYINGVEDRANKNQITQDVFVAKQDIAAGTTGDTASSSGLFDRVTVPAKVIPSGAITSLEQISGRIAAVQIFKGEIIVQQRFVAPGQAIKGLLPIPPGKQAVSISISGAPAVGGFVQPGDQVTLVVSSTKGIGGRPVTGGGPLVKFLMQKLDVIAVGNQVVTNTAAPINNQTTQQPQNQGGIWTFALTPTQIEQLIFAMQNTTPYFTLLPEKSNPVKTAGRTFANLFS
jgi:pilus assembly protein CpaB